MYKYLQCCLCWHSQSTVATCVEQVYQWKYSDSAEVLGCCLLWWNGQHWNICFISEECLNRVSCPRIFHHQLLFLRNFSPLTALSLVPIPTLHETGTPDVSSNWDVYHDINNHRRHNCLPFTSNTLDTVEEIFLSTYSSDVLFPHKNSP